MAAVREVSEAGGLMASGASVTGMYAHAAVYVDKVLKGGEAAKALGFTIPPSLLARADRVIE